MCSDEFSLKHALVGTGQKPYFLVDVIKGGPIPDILTVLLQCRSDQGKGRTVGLKAAPIVLIDPVEATEGNASFFTPPSSLHRFNSAAFFHTRNHKRLIPTVSIFFEVQFVYSLRWIDVCLNFLPVGDF